MFRLTKITAVFGTALLAGTFQVALAQTFSAQPPPYVMYGTEQCPLGRSGIIQFLRVGLGVD
jgi:hypothetical protein